MLMFLAILCTIIFIHELGHLIVAKLCKCGVSVFSIGLGPALVKKQIGKTTYQIAPFLLGGYCQLEGENLFSRRKYSFCNLPYRSKLFISYAGILMNILTGLPSLLFSLFLLHSYATHPVLFVSLGRLIEPLYMFGSLSLILGITNALPIPALDGSYPLLYLLEFGLGKRRALVIIQYLVTRGMLFIMILNIISLPLLWELITK